MGALGSAFIGSNAAKQAAAQQAQASQAAIGLEKDIFGQTQANLAPYLSAGLGGIASLQPGILAGQNALTNQLQPSINTGIGATYTLASLYGINPQTGGANAGANAVPTQQNWLPFFNSPDYQFAFDQGQRATQNVLSAQGNLLSGGGLTALQNFGQGLASQQYGNYFNRLLQLAQTGNSAATTVGQLGTDAAKSIASIGGSTAGTGANAASNFGNTLTGLYTGLGQNLASGTVGSANALMGGLTGATGNMGNALMLYGLLGNKSPAVSSYGTLPTGATNVFDTAKGFG